MNMLESDWSGNEALLSAANSFSRKENDTELVMTSGIWHMDLKGSIQFWIKTVDRVWQTSLTEELKIRQFLPLEMRQIGAKNENCLRQWLYGAWEITHFIHKQ